MATMSEERDGVEMHREKMTVSWRDVALIGGSPSIASKSQRLEETTRVCWSFLDWRTPFKKSFSGQKTFLAGYIGQFS